MQNALEEAEEPEPEERTMTVWKLAEWLGLKLAAGCSRTMTGTSSEQQLDREL
jgi:hypothetical protein